MHPIIGVTGRPKEMTSAGTQVRSYIVFHMYTDSVLSAGGVPMMLIPTSKDLVDPQLDRVDGLLMTGGGDVAPERYGEDRHESVRDVDHERDEFEIALAHKAKERGIPTFAICRGLQVVNIAFGGSLVQDLPSHGTTGHDLVGDDAYQPHSIARIEPGSRIAGIIGDGDHGVNSIHHQAVERIGDGLTVVGSAADGTVEAIESADPAWDLLAVQWHPEFLGMRDHSESHSLFVAFIEAAAKYRADQ
jgi:putative glutamine amidotransferase